MTKAPTTNSSGLLVTKLTANSNIMLAAGLVSILATLLIPLPTILIDLLIIVSVSMSIFILITTLSANEAMDLSTFPSILLVITLYRLALNVASTRQILLQGNAGHMIDTFGKFVAGGNLVVGMVIFLILVIIQFVVITKGAERISEVGARFVLDAMPGKQMAIDADLNAGNITDVEARTRREKIIHESEFYGAMDGASKFIRGDAVAGLIITAINLIGGMVIGSAQGMTIIEAAKKYCILSIGDGLVSQIPSIIISLSSGFLVTKTRSDNTISQDLAKQMLKGNQPLIIAAVIIAIFSLVPGFPKLPFLMISAGMGAIAYTNITQARKASTQPKASQKSEREEEPVETLLDMDAISLLVGVRLIGMVDPRKKSNIFERIGAIRRKFAQQLGMIIPLVRLRDNINLEPNSYEIRIFDHIVASGSLEPDHYLAMDSGLATTSIQGIQTKEPVYGLPAVWISEKDKESAELNGYTVIDPESVLITHLSETLNLYSYELLTREDVQQLVDRLRKSQPSLVGDVVGELVNIGLLQRVLQNLLKDCLPIRDLPKILEALSENAPKTKNVSFLTELVRKAISRTITETYKNSDGRIIAISLDPELEHDLVSCVRQEGENMILGITPDKSMMITQRASQEWTRAMEKGYDSVILLCDSRIRRPLSDSIKRSIPRMPVVAYDEMVMGTDIEPVAAITLDDHSSNVMMRNRN